MLTPPLPHAHSFHSSDTCSLDFNGSTKFWASMLSLISFQMADPALVLECYAGMERVNSGEMDKNATHKKMTKCSTSNTVAFLIYCAPH